MSKPHNIRWTDADHQELNRRIRNYNAKITRLQEKYRDNPDVIIPEKITKKQMVELIGTRRDLQREMKSLERFSKRGSEEIVTIPSTDNNIQLTKWQKEEMSRRAGIVNRKRNQRRKELEEQELSHGGDSLGYTRGDIGMGKANEVVLRPTKPFTPKMTKEDVKHKYKHLFKESQSDYWHKRDLIMRDSFIKALQQNFNSKDIKDVIKAIEDMPIEQFKEKLLSDPEDFSTAYPPDDEEYNAYLNQLKAIWTPEKVGLEGVKTIEGKSKTRVGKK